MRRQLLVILLALIGLVTALHAATREDDLRTEIETRNVAIKKLEQEIAGYQTQLNATGKQVASLNGDIKRLDTTIKKFDADIKLTGQKILNSTATIEKLSLDIGNKSEEIEDNKESIRETLRALWHGEGTLIEQLLAAPNLADAWSEQERLGSLQGKVYERIGTLRELKTDLESRKQETVVEKGRLKTLNDKLADQKQVSNATKQTKAVLLSTTKDKEAEYKRLLADRQAKKVAFEQELFNFESQLKLIIDPSSVPAVGKGILAWPVPNPFVTQQFGRTSDAARLYASGTHNGIDLRASIGTPITAAAAGTVIATGDTDTACRGASYGKWVLVRHDNGLSTLSAHLSLIKVATGQVVGRGSLLGYSGQTGYATGPHLHFTVAASQGVTVGKLQSKVCGTTYTLPLIDTRAYLDPLEYL